MILSDKSLMWHMGNGTISISPPSPNAIQPASIDLRLGNSFAVPDYSRLERGAITLGERLPYTVMTLDHYVLEPKAFVLATTMEYVKIPANLAASIDGRSSIGRMGLFVQNAGWIDPGFEGQITLELFNALDVPIVLVPGQRVGQLIFEHMDEIPLAPYAGKYQGQTGATGSRIEMDIEN